MTKKQIIILISIVGGILILIGGIFLIRFLQERNLQPVDVPMVKTENGQGAQDPAQDEAIQKELDMLAARPGDTDGDGFSDDEERGAGTDISQPDTDGDGSSDYQEVKVLDQDWLSPDDLYANRP